MKTINYYLLIMLSIVVISCSNDEENNNSSLHIGSQFYTCDISNISDSFQEIIMKDETHYMLTEYYDNGLVQFEVFICGDDTVGIYFNADGYPEMVSDGQQYMVLGAFLGKNLKCGILDKNGNTEILDIETEIDWNEYNLSLKSSKTRTSNNGYLLDNQKSKLQKQAGWSALECVLNFVAGYKFTLGKAGSISFVAEAIAYSISDNQNWLDAVDDTFTYSEAVSGTIQAYFSKAPIGLIVTTLKVWTCDVFLPAYEYGSFYDRDDPRSPYTAKIEYLYKTVNEATFYPNSGIFNWMGGTFYVELHVNGANFETDYLDWTVISNQPSWLSAKPDYGNGQHKLLLNIAPYLSDEDTAPREHIVVARLTNIYGDNKDLTFHVTQNTPLRTNPKSILFDEIKTVNIMVFYDEDWKIKYFPDWCEIKRMGLYGFSVTPKEIGKGLSDEIVIEYSTSYNKDKNVVFEKRIPVSQKANWNGTSWSFTGSVNATGGGSIVGGIDMANVTNFGIQIENVANNQFSLSGDLAGMEYYSNISLDEQGRLILNTTQNISEAGVYVNCTSKIAFERTEQTKSIGKLTGEANVKTNVPGTENINVKIGLNGTFNGTLLNESK